MKIVEDMYVSSKLYVKNTIQNPPQDLNILPTYKGTAVILTIHNKNSENLIWTGKNWKKGFGSMYHGEMRGSRYARYIDKIYDTDQLVGQI